MLKRLIVAFLGLVFGLSLGAGFGSHQVEAAPVFAGGRPGYALLMPTVASTTSNRFKQSWSWYMTRASGLLATLLLALLVISGVGLLTGYTYRILEPLPAWVVHRALGLAFGVMVLVHMFVLLFDKYVGFDLLDVLVPFRSQYQPLTIGNLHLGPIYMVCGILAFYGVAAIIISSLLWMQKRPKPWRLVHYSSYFVLFLVFMHGLFLGTDMKQGWAQFLWLLGAFVLLASIATRLRRVNTLGKGK